jgi:hypothetical protein
LVDASSLSPSASIEVQLRGVRFPPDMITLAPDGMVEAKLISEIDHSRYSVIGMCGHRAVSGMMTLSAR